MRKIFILTAESSDATWAGEDDFVLVEATDSGSAECSGASSGSEAAPRPRSLALPPSGAERGAPPAPVATPPEHHQYQQHTRVSRYL